MDLDRTSKNSTDIPQNMNYSCNGYGFQIEMANRIENKNLKILEVPITFEERRLGESKMSLKISIEAFILLLKLRIK